MSVVEHDRHGRRLPRAIVIPDNDAKLTRWVMSVAGAAHAAMAAAGRRGAPWRKRALSIEIVFRFRRPEGHYGVRGLRPSAPGYPKVKPDIDKLERAVLDALTGVVYDDDARIVELHSRKLYCTDTDVPGAEIGLAVLDAEQLELVES